MPGLDRFDPRIYVAPDKREINELYRVIKNIAPVYGTCSTQGSLQTQILHGHEFRAFRHKGHWVWGQAVSPIKGSDHPGYVGWVPLSALTQTIHRPTHQVVALKAPVFKRADIKSPIKQLIPITAQLSGIVEGDFLKTDTGFIHMAHLDPVHTYVDDADFVAQAERFMGLPYIWGGNGPDGLDCSGLVRLALRITGQDAPRDSDLQSQMGRSVLNEPRQRGDLVFWKGHVGIMRDEQTLLHANAFHMMTASESLSMAVERIKKAAGPVTDIRRL